jgi:hypothetical protein
VLSTSWRSGSALLGGEGGGALGSGEGLVGGVALTSGLGDLGSDGDGGLVLGLLKGQGDVMEDGALAMAWGQTTMQKRLSGSCPSPQGLTT